MHFNDPSIIDSINILISYFIILLFVQEKVYVLMTKDHLLRNARVQSSKTEPTMMLPINKVIY